MFKIYKEESPDQEHSSDISCWRNSSENILRESITEKRNFKSKLNSFKFSFDFDWDSKKFFEIDSSKLFKS